MIRPGDIVRHVPKGQGSAVSYGIGMTVAEWGSWYACRSCFKELPRGMDCPDCLELTFLSSGTGIWDVEFQDGKTRSINECWLHKTQ